MEQPGRPDRRPGRPVSIQRPTGDQQVAVFLPLAAAVRQWVIQRTFSITHKTVIGEGMKALERFCILGLTLAVLGAARAEEPDDTRIITHILAAHDENLRSVAA